MAQTRFYKNSPSHTIPSGVANATTTSIVVDSVAGFPTQFPFTCIIEPDLTLEEIVDVSAIVGTTLTVVRGVDGSTASAHAAGVKIVHGVSARDFTEMNDHINDSTDVHGVTGSVVGTGGTQTISGQKNFTGGLQRSGSEVVDLASVQTITGRKVFDDAETTAGGNVMDVGSIQTGIARKVFDDLETTAGGDVVAVGGAQNITGVKTLTSTGAIQSGDSDPDTLLNADGTGRLREIIFGHFIQKSADEGLLNSSTPQGDNHLLFPVVANAKYLVEVSLFVTVSGGSSTSDFKVGWGLPSGASFNMGGYGADIALASTSSSGDAEFFGLLGAAAATISYGLDSDGTTFIRLFALIITAGTGGTATLEWAQNVAVAGITTTVKAGSWMRATRVG